MIEPSTVQSVVAGAYGVVFLATVAVTLRVRSELRWYCGLLAVVVGLSAGNIALQQAGIGAITTEQGQLFVGTLLAQTIAYTVLYGGVTRLAGASRRLTAGVIGVALLPTYLSQLGNVIDGGQLFTLVSLVAFVVPFPLLTYLFVRPIWRTAQEQPPVRRLLHWKARNIILFLYGMLLVYIGIAISGLVTDPTLNELLFQYTGFVFNAGIPAFFVYKFYTVGDRFVEEVGV